MSSYECITDPNCYIELLELCPCSCVAELRKCEGKWIQQIECVNKNVAGRTKKELQTELKNEYHRAKGTVARCKDKDGFIVQSIKKGW